MRDESKSEIDFVVVEEGCVNRVVNMVIHENDPKLSQLDWSMY